MGEKLNRALLAIDKLEINKWEVGSALNEALEANEVKSIREFCLLANGNLEKEDTYGRYVKAQKFYLLCEDLGEAWLQQLDITFFAEAWMGLEDGWDFEDILDAMLTAWQEKKTVAWFRARRAEATGKTTPLFRRLDRQSKMLEKLSEAMPTFEQDLQGLLHHKSIDIQELAGETLTVLSHGGTIWELSQLFRVLAELLEEDEKS